MCESIQIFAEFAASFDAFLQYFGFQGEKKQQDKTVIRGIDTTFRSLTGISVTKTGISVAKIGIGCWTNRTLKYSNRAQRYLHIIRRSIMFIHNLLLNIV